MKSFLVIVFALLGSLTAQTEGQKFTPPPGDEPPEIKKMIDKGQMWLETKQTTTTGLLKDVKFLKVHEYPRFRKLIRPSRFRRNTSCGGRSLSPLVK